MSQTQTITDSLQSARQYIELFLTKLYALDVEKLDTTQRLKVLVFYEELVSLLHNNTILIDPDQYSSANLTTKP